MQAFDMIKIGNSRKKTGDLIIFFLVMIALFTGRVKLSYAEERGYTSVGIRTIVLDPGHGDYDNGAQGPAGSKEKELTLKFAQILAKELMPEYAVELTRNGDYQVDLTRRASVANYHRGDMFISIHTGGGSRYQMDAWSIYYYSKTDSSEGGIRSAGAGSDYHQGSFRQNEEDLRLKWDQVQFRHQKESRSLAGCIKIQLAANPDIREVAVSAAALRVLEGLDMPAIIIETGYLTNPKTEKQLNEDAFLTEVAKQIKKGVDVYLTR
jgi:N-acetylmuramoyl-L-alanine amidase